MNGRNYFAPTGDKPAFRRNQYGFAVGGPVRRNSTFFFADWQGTRQRVAIPRLSTVPSAAQRAGQFSGAIYDPATANRTQFAGNHIPINRLDPVAAQVLARYPAANLPGTANNYVREGVEPDNQDQFDIRLDQYLGSTHRLFGRYSQFRDDDTPVTPLPDGSGALTTGVISRTKTRGYQWIGEYEWSLRPQLLNQLRFGFTQRKSRGEGPLNGGLIVPGTPDNSFGAALATFNVTGFAQIGPSAGANSQFSTDVTEVLDTFSAVKGRHTIKFGVDFRRQALNVVQPANPAGLYTF